MKRGLAILCGLWLLLGAGATYAGAAGNGSQAAEDELPVEIRMRAETPTADETTGDVLDISHSIMPLKRVHRPTFESGETGETRSPALVERPSRPGPGEAAMGSPGEEPGGRKPETAPAGPGDGAKKNLAGASSPRDVAGPEGRVLQGASPADAIRMVKERTGGEAQEATERPERPERPRPERVERPERPLTPGERPLPDLNQRYHLQREQTGTGGNSSKMKILERPVREDK